MNNHEKLGEAIVELLSLKIKSNGRIETSWGDKTLEGLGATVERVAWDALASPTDLASVIDASKEAAIARIFSAHLKKLSSRK